MNRFLAFPLLFAATCAAAEKEGAAPTEAQIAEALREADKDYRAKLDDLLVKAQLAGSPGLVEDIKARQAATAKYRQPIAADQPKKVVIVGCMKAFCELVVTKDQLNWRDPGPYGGPADLTVNGIAWEIKWVNQECVTPLKIPLGEIVKWEATGGVTVRRIPRGEGVIGFKITAKGERATFTFRLSYR